MLYSQAHSYGSIFFAAANNSVEGRIAVRYFYYLRGKSIAISFKTASVRQQRI